ncbi:MAG: DNA polymerase III subunit alpha [Saprospiraceae bacterium]
MPEFCHLHCHTQYSLLDGASHLEPLMDKAKADGQKGLAMTDHGNMFGAFKFVSEAKKRHLKAIIGCEFYLVEDRHKKSFQKSLGLRDVRYHQLLLAKNAQGYINLSKLCSLGYIEGIYGKFPRIDKELVIQYHEGLIATSCCLAAEIPRAIQTGNLELAEQKLRWWLDLFGEDFYIEIMRHRGLETLRNTDMSQEDVNQHLLKMAAKYEIKTIVSNDAHYVNEEDSKAHEILLCVNTGSKLNDENRFQFSSSDYYLKSQQEMTDIFKDIPEAVYNTIEVMDKIETPELTRDILLPNFPLPTGFSSQAEYLRHLVYEGAKIKYKEITEVVRERLDYELNIIKSMGFDGYFLIVQDFIKAARKIGVSVGPGRGSAAGSAVAFALTITNVDPIKYNLLFERFLNPERISMPDIDIDFDDEGRQKVIDWVVEKYGKTQVAQIITFGTMAAKSSIKDVGRVMSLPLDQTSRIANLVPSRPGTKLKNIFGNTKEELKKNWQGDDYSNVQKLLEVEKQKDLEGDVVKIAQRMEGTVRNVGIHAAGVIIAPDDITQYIPVCTSKESNLLVTQFDGSIVEDAGMLKMDFLGLKTLSIIKDCIENIVKRHGESSRIDVDKIPLEDELTFELFQRGDMIGVFQFESDGMRKYLRDLKPTGIEDLIAMNALYRPGPMDYIPSFIKRKHGQEKVEYPHEWLEEILKPTHGIMVYQEQIMQTAQIMAGYTLGKADMLRRAMGKKKLKEMEKHREIFKEGASKKGIPENTANKIFDIMEKFAAYGFNRSHAAAYSLVAFHTAYLKAHYPAEFMASVLTRNKQNIEKLNFFLRESKRMGIKVLGPNINESDLHFIVNANGAIRFGLSALKGVGEGPVTEILSGRVKGGDFTSIFDMCRRLNLRTINKKCLESLAYGGAFDVFGGVDRSQYFAPSGKFGTALEHALKYGNLYQNQQQSMQNSLFGDLTNEFLDEPALPKVDKWSKIETLKKEKDVTGIFISGHPLDEYRIEISTYTTCTIEDSKSRKDTPLKLAGLITECFHGTNQKGNGYCKFTLQDYDGSESYSLYGENYNKFNSLAITGAVVFLEGAYSRGYNSDNYYFRLNNIRLLESIGVALTKLITLEIPIQNLNSKLTESLSKLISENKGNHLLKFCVIDPDKNVDVIFVPEKGKVNINSELIDKIERLGLRYKIN